MGVRIHTIRLGVDHCYLIGGEKLIMIDGGVPGRASRFVEAMERLSIKPEEIRLIVLTHGHWDHIGSAKEIKDLTGAKLALHRQEKDWLEKSLQPLPPGVTLWGKIFVRIMAAFMPWVHVPPADVEVVLGDDEFPLASYGIPGKIVPTPGHSKGSVSVLLKSGDAFVGDLAMSGFPLRFGPGLPILAEDMQQVRESWKLLAALGAKTIYPAHGNPFPIEVIHKALRRQARAAGQERPDPNHLGYR